MHFAFGQAAWGLTGFRLTHQQALAAQASRWPRAAPRVVICPGRAGGHDVGSADLLRAWVLATLGGLATDDEHHARLRDTLLVFLQSGSSYKTAAEQMVLHKNTVHYRIRKAEETLRPASRPQPLRHRTRAESQPLARLNRAATQRYRRPSGWAAWTGSIRLEVFGDLREYDALGRVVTNPRGIESHLTRPDRHHHNRGPGRHHSETEFRLSVLLNIG